MYGGCSLDRGFALVHAAWPQLTCSAHGHCLPCCRLLLLSQQTNGPPETCGMLQAGRVCAGLGSFLPVSMHSGCCCPSSFYHQACSCCRQASLVLACRLLLSRQFQPRVGRLAAVKSREALQHRLLTSAHEQAAAAASVGATVVPLDEEQSARVAQPRHKPPQKAASERNVTDRRLLSSH